MSELYHVHGFKYIKREWQNGKWKYYYDTGSGKKTSLGLVDKISDWIGEDEKENARLASNRAASATRAATTAHNRRISQTSSYKVASGEAAYRERAANKAKSDIGKIDARRAALANWHYTAKKAPALFLWGLTASDGEYANRYLSNPAEFGFDVGIAKANPDSTVFRGTPLPIDQIQRTNEWASSDVRAYQTALRGIMESEMKSAKAYCDKYGYIKLTSDRAKEAVSAKQDSARRASDAIRSDINAQSNKREAERAAEQAKSRYESTFLGKVEKGLNWINNLFK